MGPRAPRLTDGQLIKPVGYDGLDGAHYWLPVGTRVRFYLTGNTAHMVPEDTWPDGTSDVIVMAGGVYSLEFVYADGSTSPTH